MRHLFFFFSSRRRHTIFDCDWSSDVCSSDLDATIAPVRSQLLLLSAMVLVVLVVATCNVINLFLLRAERAEREVAIALSRSEERRVGKECRSRLALCHRKEASSVSLSMD